MSSNSQNDQNGYWTGFAFGAMLGGIAAYALGTKEGKIQVATLLKKVNSLQSETEDLPALLQSVAQYLDKEKENEMKEPPKPTYE